MIAQQMKEERFAFMREDNRQFVIDMTRALEQAGYTYGDTIGDGICWGKYMLIFQKSGVKSKRVYARIYIRDASVALRLFLHDVTRQADHIDAAPERIREVFLGDAGACSHCRGDTCKFRKSYVIRGREIEKCNGEVFTFHHASVQDIPDLMRLFQAFYPPRLRR